jgi:LuxR family maltose regulon positive regulatory protein
MQKTEGWIVGIQLAGISLQNNPDKHQFVLSFAGDNRYIADYLFDEALHRQPDHIQAFLLHTSILERFNAPLCNALTQQDDSQSILAELDRANLFLVPLDNQRNWYRYHHLFGELLQNRLKQTTPEIISELHAHASIWFESNHLLADSISHALAADEIQRIVQLTENMAVHKMDTGELADLMVWLERQPETILQQYPWLLVARIWANVNTGKFDQAEIEVSGLKEKLSSQPYPEELEKRIQGHLAAIRSYLAEMRSTDANLAIKEAEEALALLDDKDIQLRSFVAIRWANSLSWVGDFQRAIQALKEAGNASKLAGDGELAINALSEMASLQMVIGQLHQANQNALETKDYAEMLAQKYGRPLPAMGILYRQLSNIKYERDELDEALVYARQAVEICQQGGEGEALCTAFYILGKVYFGLRDYDQSDHYFDQGTEIAKRLFTEGTNIALHTRSNYLLLQGKLEETEKSVGERGLTPQDQFGYQKRLEYQNFARLLAARGEFEKALEVINQVIKVIEDAGAKRFLIRAKIVQAKIFQGLNRPDEALAAIEAALEPASQGGFIRGFLDEGEAVAQLLYQAAQKGIHPEYCQLLLDRFDLQTGKAPAHQDLVEPLSERELEVLQHIARGCSNQEIAEELIVSLYTVKSHARNIFGKLGVKNRTEAVARARLYGLLPED